MNSDQVAILEIGLEFFARMLGCRVIDARVDLQLEQSPPRRVLELAVTAPELPAVAEGERLPRGVALASFGDQVRFGWEVGQVRASCGK